MDVKQITCGNCDGIGHMIKYEIVDDGVAQRKEVVCENCNGKGWTEYAFFSVEEAKAILKYCGLSAENSKL